MDVARILVSSVRSGWGSPGKRGRPICSELHSVRGSLNLIWNYKDCFSYLHGRSLLLFSRHHLPSGSRDTTSSLRSSAAYRANFLKRKREPTQEDTASAAPLFQVTRSPPSGGFHPPAAGATHAVFGSPPTGVSPKSRPPDRPLATAQPSSPPSLAASSAGHAAAWGLVGQVGLKVGFMRHTGPSQRGPDQWNVVYSYSSWETALEFLRTVAAWTPSLDRKRLKIDFPQRSMSERHPEADRQFDGVNVTGRLVQ